MDRKRLILLGSMAVLGMVLFAACSSNSMESLQQFRFSDFVASLQTVPAEPAAATVEAVSRRLRRWTRPRQLPRRLQRPARPQRPLKRRRSSSSRPATAPPSLRPSRSRWARPA